MIPSEKETIHAQSPPAKEMRDIHSRSHSEQENSQPDSDCLPPPIPENILPAHLLDAINQAVLAADTQGLIIYSNRYTEILFHTAIAELQGRKLADLPLRIPLPESPDQKRHTEIEFQNAAGATSLYRISDTPFLNSAGHHAGWIRTIDDITDSAVDHKRRRQTEADLKASQHRMQAIFDNALDAILLLDNQGRLIEVNPAACKLTGYSHAALLDHALQEFIVSDLSPSAHMLWELLMKKGEATGEYRLRRQDNSQAWVEYHAVANIAPGLHLIVLNDTTGRKLAEETLARQAHELARSNADLEQFAYIASHDLQEPLRMVSNYVQLLERRYKDRLDTEGLEFITHAVDGARRMQKMIQDLLAYSRVQTRGNPFTRVDLEKTLDQALANLDLAIEENQVQLTREPLPTLYADPLQIQQLFQNLIGNAIKFHSTTPPHIHISAHQETNEWRFAVHDNGIGIPTQSIYRLFTLFQRLNSRQEYPGTGIGLAICKKIVERHGGHIWVESQPGQGSTFYFTLPLNMEHHKE